MSTSTAAAKSRSHSKKPPASASARPNTGGQAQQVAVANSASNPQLDMRQLAFIRGNTQEWFSMIGGAIKMAPSQEEAQRYVTLANEFSRLFGQELPAQHRSMIARA